MTSTNIEYKQPFYWDNYRDTTVGRYLNQRESAFIRRIINNVPLPCQRIMDLACGSGGATLPLHQAGFNVIGTDVDPVALAAFQRRSQRVSLTWSNASHFPFANESFDCVIAIQCFEYFDQRRFFRECYRVLIGGGLLIFDAVNRHNYKRILKRSLGRTRDLHRSFNQSCGEVLRATIDYDFDIHAVSGYNWIPFDRYSNSRLVGLAAGIEQVLYLDRLYSFSPWVLVAARKRTRCE
jgi:SAM-dependent methyltransferase